MASSSPVIDARRRRRGLGVATRVEPEDRLQHLGVVDHSMVERHDTVEESGGSTGDGSGLDGLARITILTPWVIERRLEKAHRDQLVVLRELAVQDEIERRREICPDPSEIGGELL
jgi:hypothetical protein